MWFLIHIALLRSAQSIGDNAAINMVLLRSTHVVSWVNQIHHRDERINQRDERIDHRDERIHSHAVTASSCPT
jgi:hypothetical protein